MKLDKNLQKTYSIKINNQKIMITHSIAGKLGSYHQNSKEKIALYNPTMYWFVDILIYVK